jgi:mediator of RNA polymerase II transcription subunit 5
MIGDWSRFLDRCIQLRIHSDQFDAAAAQLHATCPLPGRKLAALLLQPRMANAISVDPRVTIYVERLLAAKKIDASDVLISSFQCSKDRVSRPGNGDISKETRWCNPPEQEEILFHRLSKAFQAEERPLSSTEGFRALIVVTRWMQAMVTSHTSDSMIQAMAGLQQQPQQQSINVRDGLGMLVISIIENPRMLRVLDHPKIKGRCRIPANSVMQRRRHFIAWET